MYPIQSHVAGPDPRVYSPGVFQRGILRYGYTALDSVIVEAVAQRQRSCEIVPAPAIAAINVVPVVDLMVDLDVELDSRARSVTVV